MGLVGRFPGVEMMWKAFRDVYDCIEWLSGFHFSVLSCLQDWKLVWKRLCSSWDETCGPCTLLLAAAKAS